MRFSLSGFSIPSLSRIPSSHTTARSTHSSRDSAHTPDRCSLSSRSLCFNRNYFSFMLPHPAVVHRRNPILPLAGKLLLPNYQQRFVIRSMQFVSRHATQDNNRSLGSLRAVTTHNLAFQKLLRPSRPRLDRRGFRRRIRFLVFRRTGSRGRRTSPRRRGASRARGDDAFPRALRPHSILLQRV